jgi:DNA-binding beta-propeller fold protein YncE
VTAIARPGHVTTILVATAVCGLLAVLAPATDRAIATPSVGPSTPAAPAVASDSVPGPRSGLQPDGRQLAPAGRLVRLGNLPMGGALTADGRFLWTVSSGISSNDVRVVDTRTRQVCQVIALPGASGGIALDSDHRRAYVSGLPNSRWQPSKNGLPGVHGDVIHVLAWNEGCGSARLERTIPVPPQPGAPTTQAYPLPRQGLATTPLAWPQKLAVSPDGSRLLVPLNLADAAAVVDIAHGDRVRYVAVGSYPFGAAITPGGRIGLVSNEASGTVSVIEMRRGERVADIAVGPPLSHPQGIVVDESGRRAYVALSASDQVVVVDIRRRAVERTIWVGRTAGLGTMPTAVALSPAGDRLFVAESGADELAVVAIPGPQTTRSQRWTVIGRIPTAAQPQAVATTPATADRPAQLAYVSAEGLGIGANPNGPNPVLPTDPIFWAFSPNPPTSDVFARVGYTAKLVTGQAGLLDLPSDAEVARLTDVAGRALTPSNAQDPPPGTVLRANGPITHVFFIVRENRSYDQVLGDDPRGNGDPKLTVFGEPVTPNLHALVRRFPLMDNTFANSEASIQGHYWTSAATVPDYVTRNWVQQYAARGRPNDFGTYAVAWPGNGFLFDRAEQQGISYFNYGEGFTGGYASVPDRDRTPSILAKISATAAHSDIGPPFGGCYPDDLTIGTALDGGEIFDSSLPAGAPAGSYSHVDCFRERFTQQLATGSVPALNYLTLTSDHTRGTQPGFPTPTSMVADSDLALGQLVDVISHSAIWNSSAIFLVEDDSQDGADHVNAHRIPVAVISPFARRGAVVHTRYDLLSVVRSIELILGMRPLSLNDALATPMYDAFATTADNASPVDVIVPAVDLLARNSAASPDAEWSSRLALDKPDQVSQADLDQILWHSVHGAGSAAPPPGPGAENEDERSGG